ncbi:hypothetical protein GJ744_005465 [Endocarpon pusillum]|uniref:Uncharacterized protein n=1 Tax=Endocarpon pusillum TaxID=364733 RepID=A0A8H7A731_9EURO|nr:hypothetical protein GJ744_005465 [Endocarpon pusillum]
MLRYTALSKDTKIQIWKKFLERAPAIYGSAKINIKELGQLAARSSNGRQIKNVMAGGQALASKSESPLTFSHLETVMKMNEQVLFEFNREEHTRSVFT